MKVHVLGYWGTYPGPGEATTGFLVESGEEKILLDCGSGVLAQLFKLCNIADLSAAVVTHHHHDHTADLGVFGYAALLARITGERTKKIPLYLPAGPDAIMDELRNEPLLDVQTIDAASEIQVGSVKLSFAKTVHAVYCLAVRFEAEGKTFVFSADSSQSDELTRLAAQADLFICEASMFDGQEETAKQTGHLTARQAGDVARQAGVKQLAITHYPHYGTIEDLVAQASESFGGPVSRLYTLQTLEV